MEENIKPYWHELSEEAVEQLIKDHKTWGDVQNDYQQPAWCCYPNALDGRMGCWSLIDIEPGGLRSNISNDFCKGCDCYHKQ